MYITDETQWTAVEQLHHQQQQGDNKLQGLLMLNRGTCSPFCL